MAADQSKLFFMQTSQTLHKEERLHNYRLIQKLFAEGSSFFDYPFRVIFIKIPPDVTKPPPFPVQCLFTVSKRVFKKAVDRNRIKRLVREAYRKNKMPLYAELTENQEKLAVALVFNGKQMPEYANIEVKIINIIKRLIVEFDKKIN